MPMIRIQPISLIVIFISISFASAKTTPAATLSDENLLPVQLNARPNYVPLDPGEIVLTEPIWEQRSPLNARFKFSWDRKWLAVITKNQVELIDIAAQKRIYNLTDTIEAAFYPDNRRVLLSGKFGGAGNNDSALLNLETGFIDKTVNGWGENLLEFFPDGRRLLVSSLFDTTAEVYDFHTHERLYTTDRLGVGPIDVSFSADYSRFTLSLLRGGVVYRSGSAGNSDILVIDAESGKTIQTLIDKTNIEENPNVTWSAVITSDGQYVISSNSNQDLITWVVSTGALLHRFSLPKKSLAFDLTASPDNKYIMVGMNGFDNFLFDWRNQRRVQRYRDGSYYETRVAYSPDGKHIAAGTVNLVGEGYTRVMLWDASNVISPTWETPTAMPLAPTPKVIPSVPSGSGGSAPTYAMPAMPETPTATPTYAAPTPYSLQTENVTLTNLIEQDFRPPNVYKRIRGYSYNKERDELFVLADQEAYRLTNVTEPVVINDFPVWQQYDYSFYSRIWDVSLADDGAIYASGFSDPLQRISPDGKITKWQLDQTQEPYKYYYTCNDLHIIEKNDNIPSTETGDILLVMKNIYGMSQLIKINPHSIKPAFEVVLPFNALPQPIHCMALGPNNQLFFAAGGYPKLYRLDGDCMVREQFHIQIGTIPHYYTPHSMAYSPHQDSFLFLCSQQPDFYNQLSGGSNYSYKNTYLIRTSRDGLVQQEISHLSPPTVGDLAFLTIEPGRTPGEFYVSDRYSLRSFVLTAPTAAPINKTPTFTPTPSPVQGWFVLDGFGGIHTSNPEMQRPQLPYIAGYDIFRDLEPDALGRGWYMLDGHGGIHRSSGQLPLPAELPYFNFDIARNLEVQERDGQTYFYLLDGYGVIHTDDPEFSRGKLPWQQTDFARDLEPDPNENGWLVLDHYGLIHGSHRPTYDLPLDFFLTPPTRWPTLFRALVRFDDETSVLLDSWGGRHTNPLHPAKNVMKGISADLYFPGWDIVWDAEAISSQN